MSVIQTPVLIVGAGPAGVATSLFLSAVSIPHYIIDKASFPRDKVCGDGFTGHSLEVLAQIDPSWIEEIATLSNIFHPAHGLTFSAPNSKMLTIPFHGAGPDGQWATCFTATRLKFDDYLFRKIDEKYATILQECSITSIKKSSFGQEVVLNHKGTEIQIATKIVVGADGDKSIVRKILQGNNEPSKAHSVALRGYYSGVAGIVQQRNLELHFLPELSPGYLWIFAMPNSIANVGIGMLSSDVRKRNINLREVMLKALASNHLLAPRFKNAKLEGKISGWGIPMCMKQAPISGDGFLLAGDAAQLVDPFSGEGIGNALYSGMVAARAIKTALAKGNTTAAHLAVLYDKPVYKKLGAGIRKSIILQKISSYPTLFNIVLNKAHKSATLRNSMTGMFTSTNFSHLLWSPKFYARVLLNR